VIWVTVYPQKNGDPRVSDVSVLQYYCNNEAIFVPFSAYETAILKGF